ncbi:MAG: FAD-dependent oxidoreductase [Pseudomonadota bacterium]|nr:FAD-dependent oxidoreductase [Pseudomonadota bacterium]
MDKDPNKPLTIIGSGLAGYTLARELRKRDSQRPIRIITADAGYFYSKPMLSNALRQHKTPEQLITATAAEMAQQLNAEIKTHSPVTQVDVHQQLLQLNTEIIEYKELICAWGAQPISLPLAGTAVHQVYTINHLADYYGFRAALTPGQRVLIMGAGLIGCEFANDLQQAGFKVTIVDPEPYPLGRLVPPVVGQALKTALAQLGVQWYLANKVTQIDNSQKTYQVELADGSCFTTELLLSAVGLQPQRALAPGLTIERGIVVDRYLRTQYSGIYALGDCAQVETLLLPFVMPLMAAARALAQTLSGQLTAVHYPPMPIIVKTPALPITLLPPPLQVQGEWHVEQHKQAIRALFLTPEQQLRGFALTGDYVTEKFKLLNDIPPLLT